MQYIDANYCQKDCIKTTYNEKHIQLMKYLISV